MCAPINGQYRTFRLRLLNKLTSSERTQSIAKSIAVQDLDRRSGSYHRTLNSIYRFPQIHSRLRKMMKNPPTQQRPRARATPRQRVTRHSTGRARCCNRTGCGFLSLANGAGADATNVGATAHLGGGWPLGSSTTWALTTAPQSSISKLALASGGQQSTAYAFVAAKNRCRRFAICRSDMKAPPLVSTQCCANSAGEGAAADYSVSACIQGETSTAARRPGRKKAPVSGNRCTPAAQRHKW